MEKLINISLFIIVSYTSAHAQIAIVGRIQNKKNNPIEFANVFLTDKNHKLITGTTTNEKGHFKLTTKKGVYTLTISFVGYKDYKKGISIDDKNKNLGIIILQQSSDKLKEIVITDRKPLIQQKVDRLVFNIENSVAASGGDALDALKITPSVNVQNNGLSIIGKGKIRVMINDRLVQLSGENLINYLHSIASDDIKNIEVITTPPAKYDAEGNGGLININLKKAKKNSWNNQIRTSYLQTSFPAIKLGNTFNYNHGKVSLFASVDSKKGYKGQIINMNIDYPTEPWIGKIKMKKKQDFISGRFGLDYDISKKISIGFLYAGTVSDKDISDTNNTLIYNTKAKKIGSFMSKGYNDKNGQNHSLNGHYIQRLDTLGRKVSIDIDYFTYQNTQNRNFNSERIGLNPNLFKANNVSSQNINNYSVQIDVDYPIKWAKLSYGAKITGTKTKNIADFYNTTSGTSLIDNTKSDNFEYTENIKAFYFDMAKTFGKKWQTKIGLRLENTETKGISKANKDQLNKQNYTKLFPAFYLSYIKNRNNIFNFSYNKRIRRPGFSALNPFRFYLNATSYVQGNPFLRPIISDNLTLKHIYKKKLISKVFIIFQNDGFSQIPKVNSTTNEQIYTMANFYKGSIYGVSETFLYSPFNWWNTTSQVAVNFLDVKSIMGYDFGMNIINGVNFHFYTQQSLFFNSEKSFQADVTIKYSPIQKMMIYNISPSFTMNLEVKKTFFNEKIQGTLGVYDLFKTKASDVTTYTNGVKQVYNNYYDSQYFKIGVSYIFGNKKIKVKQGKFGNEKEQQRSKQ